MGLWRKKKKLARISNRKQTEGIHESAALDPELEWGMAIHPPKHKGDLANLQSVQEGWHDQIVSQASEDKS